MRKSINTLTVLFIGLSIGSAFAQGLPDLKVEDINIEPLPAGVQGPKLQLHMYRSYRFQVTVRNMGTAAANSCFVVRTECVRQGKAVSLGEARVGQVKSPHIYAVYNVYPSSAGAGDCTLRTVVDAEQNVNESDESPLSNIWDRKATILP